MLSYLLKRLLYIIPTLLVISLLAFSLSRMTPGDQVLKLCGDPLDPVNGYNDLKRAEIEYANCARRLNLDKPFFYVTLTSRAYPDTLHKILKADRRRTQKRLIAQYGNWPQIQQYYNQIKSFQLSLPARRSGLDEQNILIEIRRTLGQLYVSYDDSRISSLLNSIEAEYKKIDLNSLQVWQPSHAAFQTLRKYYAKVKAEAAPSNLWIPSLQWNGVHNQYHYWVTSFFSGDFGVSLIDGQAAFTKISKAAFWTILLNLIALFFAFGIAIPIGVYAASGQGKRFDRWSTLLLFVLYSLPSFWVATLLIVFFTTPEYGRWLHWFPTIGLSSLPPDAPFWSRFWDIGAHLILPVVCLTYPVLAFISRQMRGGILSVLSADYIRTAKAIGLQSGTILWKHAFRNALFPIITMIASIVPGMLAGSVVIEYIFALPGMGRLTFDSILQNDWPVVFAILFLAALLTIIGNLIADLLYFLSDPRVNFSSKKGD